MPSVRNFEFDQPREILKMLIVISSLYASAEVCSEVWNQALKTR